MGSPFLNTFLPALSQAAGQAIPAAMQGHIQGQDAALQLAMLKSQLQQQQQANQFFPQQQQLAMEQHQQQLAMQRAPQLMFGHAGAQPFSYDPITGSSRAVGPAIPDPYKAMHLQNEQHQMAEKARNNQAILEVRQQLADQQYEIRKAQAATAQERADIAAAQAKDRKEYQDELNKIRHEQVEWQKTHQGGLLAKSERELDLKEKSEAFKERMTTGKASQLPASAIKMQRDELDLVNAASGINTVLSKSLDQLNSGTLKLGPLENVMSRGRNLAGKSSPESRNFASFTANLERLRNDSLRLNKGVQTEGDAVRAWNELVNNINDKEVVTQRLQEIIAINKRAVDLHKINVDVIRKNYNVGPLTLPDPSPLASQSAPASEPSSRKPVTATGPNGQKLMLKGGKWVPIK